VPPNRPLLPQPELRGQVVHLVPLGEHHVEPLVAAASVDRTTYTFTSVPADVPSMAAYVADVLRQRDDGLVLPYVQQSAADGRVLGCTRVMTMSWWFGREHPDEVEIGGTWLAADAQRTAVNTEAKWLLLTQAFERWRTARVFLCTDARNVRSRTAIERIGATFEGVLRSHRGSHVAGEEGRPRDSAVFSIVAAEWPQVDTELRTRLGAAGG
jgi:RimJ/RimL family protein N-acetyltransferase